MFKIYSFIRNRNETEVLVGKVGIYKETEVLVGKVGIT